LILKKDEVNFLQGQIQAPEILFYV